MRFGIIVLILLVSSCSSPKKETGGLRTILCSFYPMYIMTRNVVGDAPGVTVENMAQVQAGCLHDYQLTPEDMKKISAAALLVVNGGGTESFLDRAIRRRPGLTIIEASRGVEMIRTSVPHEHDHHEAGEHRTDHEEPEFNPHVWVSVSGAIAQVKNIRDGLAAADSANAPLYRDNADAYVAKLEALREKMRAGLADVSSRDIVTFHEAFPYFARDLDLTIVAVVQREPGSQPSAGELAQIIRVVKKARVKALFAEPSYPANAAETIARETGSSVYTLDPAVAGPLDPDAYIRIMESNLSILQKALR